MINKILTGLILAITLCKEIALVILTALLIIKFPWIFTAVIVCCLFYAFIKEPDSEDNK